MLLINFVIIILLLMMCSGYENLHKYGNDIIKGGIYFKYLGNMIFNVDEDDRFMLVLPVNLTDIIQKYHPPSTNEIITLLKNDIYFNNFNAWYFVEKFEELEKNIVQVREMYGKIWKDSAFHNFNYDKHVGEKINDIIKDMSPNLVNGQEIKININGRKLKRFDLLVNNTISLFKLNSLFTIYEHKNSLTRSYISQVKTAYNTNSSMLYEIFELNTLLYNIESNILDSIFNIKKIIDEIILMFSGQVSRLLLPQHILLQHLLHIRMNMNIPIISHLSDLSYADLSLYYSESKVYTEKIDKENLVIFFINIPVSITGEEYFLLYRATPFWITLSYNKNISTQIHTNKEFLAIREKNTPRGQVTQFVEFSNLNTCTKSHFFYLCSLQFAIRRYTNDAYTCLVSNFKGDDNKIKKSCDFKFSNNFQREIIKISKGWLFSPINKPVTIMFNFIMNDTSESIIQITHENNPIIYLCNEFGNGELYIDKNFIIPYLYIPNAKKINKETIDKNIHKYFPICSQYPLKSNTLDSIPIPELQIHNSEEKDNFLENLYNKLLRAIIGVSISLLCLQIISIFIFYHQNKKNNNLISTTNDNYDNNISLRDNNNGNTTTTPLSSPSLQNNVKYKRRGRVVDRETSLSSLTSTTYPQFSLTHPENYNVTPTFHNYSYQDFKISSTLPLPYSIPTHPPPPIYPSNVSKIITTPTTNTSSISNTKTIQLDEDGYVAIENNKMKISNNNVKYYNTIS